MSYLDPKGRDFSGSDVHLRTFALAVYDADDNHQVNRLVGQGDREQKLPDLLSRLVFADRLEELGYGVRAEFIRLCCAIAIRRQSLGFDPAQVAYDENDPAYDTPEIARLITLLSPPKVQVN